MTPSHAKHTAKLLPIGGVGSVNIANSLNKLVCVLREVCFFAVLRIKACNSCMRRVFSRGGPLQVVRSVISFNPIFMVYIILGKFCNRLRKKCLCYKPMYIKMLSAKTYRVITRLHHSQPQVCCRQNSYPSIAINQGSFNSSSPTKTRHFNQIFSARNGSPFFHFVSPFSGLCCLYYRS